MFRAVRCLLSTLFILACARPEPRVVSEGEREVRRDAFAEVWRRNIDSEDTLFAVPSKLLLVDDYVVVLDPSANRVVGLSRSNGERQWVFGATGSGPGEMRTPSDIEVSANGEVWVVDPGNGKILVLSPNGRLLRERLVGGVSNLRSACIRADGHVLGYQLGLSSPLVVLDTSLASRALPRFPWAVPIPRSSAGLSQFELSEFVRLTQSIMVSAGGDRCLLARQTAPGVAMMQGDSVLWINEQIKPPAVDSLRENTSTAISVAIVGDRALVAYHGTGKRRGRLVDVYDASTGKYLQSWETPGGMSWISAQGKNLAVLRSRASGSSIAMWALRDP